MSKVTRQEIMQGNPWQLFYRLSAPGILGMLLISFNALTDAFFISHMVGEHAFAGVSLTLPLFVINSALTTLLASGISILYSRLIGQGDNEHLQVVLFQQLFLLVILVSVFLALFAIMAGKPLLHLLGARYDTLEYGRVFYVTACIGNLPSLLGLCLSGVLRAGGQLKKSMQITIIAVAVNIICNPLLVKVLHLGTQGAALASVVSMTVYSLLTLHFFLKDHHVPRSIHFQWEIMKEILLTGLPAFFMQLNGLMRQFILFRLVTYNAVSTHQVSFFAAVYRLFSFAAIPVFGILQALQPVLGINYGAKQYRRVQQAIDVFRFAAVIMMIIIAIIMMLFSRQLLLLLLDAIVLMDVSSHLFLLVLLVLPFMPVASTGIVFLQATGMRKQATTIIVLRELLLFIPIMLMAVHLYTYEGIFYGLLTENVLYCMSVYFITSAKMKQKLVLQ